MNFDMDDRDLSRVAEVATAPVGTSILDLATLGGLDPARDFIAQDLRGWPLTEQDLRGFDLSRSDLRGTGIENAIFDATTIFEGAQLDHRARRLITLKFASERFGDPKPETYTKVRIPDLSDDELLDRQFVIRKPLALSDVVYAPPPTDQWLTYEGRYDTDEVITCAFGHKHRKGYVFRDEVNLRYFVGNSCGAKHLGMKSWKEFAGERELLEERASYLRTIRDLKEVFVRNREWIGDLRDSPAVISFDATLKLLNERHPELVKSVRKISADGGRIDLIVKERDFRAEERARQQEAERNKEAGQPAPTVHPEIYRNAWRQAGVLRGKTIFLLRTNLRTQIEILFRIINAFLDQKRVIERKDLLLTVKNARLQVDKVLAIIKNINEYASFYSDTNMQLFIEWGNLYNFDRSAFSIDKGCVVINRPDGSLTVMIPPPPADIDPQWVQDMSTVAGTWKAMDGKSLLQ